MVKLTPNCRIIYHSLSCTGDESPEAREIGPIIGSILCDHNQVCITRIVQCIPALESGPSHGNERLIGIRMSLQHIDLTFPIEAELYRFAPIDGQIETRVSVRRVTGNDGCEFMEFRCGALIGLCDSCPSWGR